MALDEANKKMTSSGRQRTPIWLSTNDLEFDLNWTTFNPLKYKYIPSNWSNVNNLYRVIYIIRPLVRLFFGFYLDQTREIVDGVEQKSELYFFHLKLAGTLDQSAILIRMAMSAQYMRVHALIFLSTLGFNISDRKVTLDFVCNLSQWHTQDIKKVYFADYNQHTTIL